MEPSSSAEAAPPSMEPKKTSWGKIAAVVIALIVIVGGIAAYIVLTAPPPTPANNPPTISTVTADKGAADIGQQVSFTATATDADGDTLTYTWNFGDNSTGTGATVTHQFLYAGNYIAIVTVSDGKGGVVASESRPVFVLVNQAEEPMPTSPTGTPDPVAILSADRSIVQVNNSVIFNGNSSWTWAYDAALAAWAANEAGLNATAVPTLSYNFGDGTAPVSGSPVQVGQVTHQFATAGSQFVRLSVTNYLGRQSSIVGYTVRVTAAAPPSGVVKNPDIFTDVLFGEPDSLDPAFDYESAGNQVIQNIVENLIWYDREKADVFVPQLATKVPDLANPADVSPDGMTYNFTLRSGVLFHSGRPVNCAAVEFSIERVLVLNDGRSPAWILDQSLTAYAEDDPGTSIDERMEAINASVTCPAGGTGLQVQFHLVIPYPAFLATLAYTVASVIDPNPASYRVTGQCASTNLMTSYCNDQLIGTGPFKLRVWQANQQIILDRNDQYWRTAAKFREVHILKANDQATRVLMLKAGDADSITLNPNHKNDIRDTQGNVLPGILEFSGPTFVVNFLGFNQDINVAGGPSADNDIPADFFQDVNLRKAFSYAWQYDNYINNVYYGYGTRVCGPIPQGMFGYDPTTPCYSYDLARAQQFFQLAQDTRPGASGTYWDNGFRLTIYYNTGNTVREEGARQLATTLKNLNANFDVRFVGLEWATFLDYVNNHVPSLFFLGWAPDYADPDDYVVPFLRSGQFFPDRVSYSNSTLDGLIDAQSQELDPNTRLSLLQEIQRAPYYDVPYIWTVQSKSIDVFRSWIGGFYNNPMYSGNYYYVLTKA